MIYASANAANTVCQRMNKRPDYRKVEVCAVEGGFAIRECRNVEPSDAQIDRSQAMLRAILGDAA